MTEQLTLTYTDYLGLSEERACLFRGEEGEPRGFSSPFEINLQKGAQMIIVQLTFSQSEHSDTQNLECHQPLVSLPFSHYLPPEATLRFIPVGEF